ncbi:MAG: hypothetical protein J6U97_04685 [Bacteroidaceae bacterium]|nr:hypothetical protein [Bacteroidaceae bacterium]
MKAEYIKKAAHCFRTDEETIEKFIHDFFAAPDIIAALEVRDNFIEAHIRSTTPEEVDDFLLYLRDRLSNKGEDNGT